MDQGPEIREQFIHAMSGVFSSVSIVATGRGSNRLAVTASAVSSVSADPPMLLVCLQRRSPVCSAITMNGHFSLNILAEDQEEQSQIFSGRCPAHLAYKFNDRDWEQVPPGLPVLKGSVANFVCRLHQFIDAGTHRIFIGRVLDVNSSKNLPLLYGRRHYTVPRVPIEQY